jgi:uncharacterized membrane protein/rubredoxin
MKKYVRCKSCGYIMEEGKLKDTCPACSVPRKMFEEYTPTISAKRARILDSHIHPIIVHAPQSFALFTLIFTVIYLFAGAELRNGLFSTIKVLSFCLPIVAIAAIASGVLDGITRFRKVTTLILERKILFGGIFFVFSCGMLVLTMFFSLETPAIVILFAVSNFICFVSSGMLGLLGSSIINARFPG